MHVTSFILKMFINDFSACSHFLTFQHPSLHVVAVLLPFGHLPVSCCAFPRWDCNPSAQPPLWKPDLFSPPAMAQPGPEGSQSDPVSGDLVLSE